MHWFHSLLTTMFLCFGRHRIINDRLDQEPYLERYYIFLKERDSFPFNIFLQRFIKSDPDDLHDHPWNYRTFILFGGYWEHTINGRFWRGPGSYIYAPANTFHRVELDKNIPYCWTLFIPGRKNKDWGFLENGKWIQHEEYLKCKKNN
jgi:hypothetical protein